MALIVPAGWQDRLTGYQVAIDGGGLSGAEVYRLSAPGKPDLFLKREMLGPFAELPAEMAKLHWLAGQGISVPQVLATAQETAWQYLLMTALPGSNLGASLLPPEAKVDMAAAALRRLHALPLGACPFDRGLGSVLASAATRLAAGLVDEDDFDAENVGRSGQDLLADLQTTQPAVADIVVTHGDAGFANLMADGDTFSGFIDCGRLGKADRYQDLSIVARDIAEDLGGEWLAPFFAAYGLQTIDSPRLSYYRNLDEFF
jgi:aminoglycoside 3'-phosphotransferase II